MNLSEKLNTYLTALEEAMPMVLDKANEAGRVAWDMMLWIERVEGLSGLMPAVGAALFCAISYKAMKHATCKIGDIESFNQKASYSDKKDESAWIGIQAICFIVSCLMAFWCVTGLLNVWNWVSVFAPEIAIARDVLEAVKGAVK